MAMSGKQTAVSVAAGVFALGAGIGVATIASADPTPSAPSSSGTSSSGPATSSDRGDWGHRGGGHGNVDGDLSATLATKLGVDQARIETALQELRDAARSDSITKDPAIRPTQAERDTAMAKGLADKLNVDQAKVTQALADIRAERNTERAADLKSTLDSAVKAGTLTQAEADAVQKAVEKGVINPGH